MDEFNVFVESMGTDILALNETKLHQSIKQQLTELTRYKRCALRDHGVVGGFLYMS